MALDPDIRLSPQLPQKEIDILLGNGQPHLLAPFIADRHHDGPNRKVLPLHHRQILSHHVTRSGSTDRQSFRSPQQLVPLFFQASAVLHLHLILHQVTIPVQDSRANPRLFDRQFQLSQVQTDLRVIDRGQGGPDFDKLALADVHLSKKTRTDDPVHGQRFVIDDPPGGDPPRPWQGKHAGNDQTHDQTDQSKPNTIRLLRRSSVNQVGHKTPTGQQEPANTGEQRQDDAGSMKHRGGDEQHSDVKQQPPCQRSPGVDSQELQLATGFRRRFGRYPHHVATPQVPQVFLSGTIQVLIAEQITENVIAIKPHQEIAIEQQSRDTGHCHQVMTELA